MEKFRVALFTMEKLDKPLDAIIKERRDKAKEEAKRKNNAKKKSKDGKPQPSAVDEKRGGKGKKRENGESGRSSDKQNAGGGKKTPPVKKNKFVSKDGATRRSLGERLGPLSAGKSRTDSNNVKNRRAHVEAENSKDLAPIATGVLVEIDNLDHHITQSDIVGLLKHFGFGSVVTTVKFKKGRATALFSKRPAAKLAVNTLDGRELDGRPIAAKILDSKIFVVPSNDKVRAKSIDESNSKKRGDSADSKVKHKSQHRKIR